MIKLVSFALIFTSLGLSAEILHVQGSTSPAANIGDAVTQGQKFTTQANSQLLLSPIAGVTLGLSQNTIVEITEIDTSNGKKKVSVFLHQGTLLTDITSKVDFTLETPDQQAIKAIGTSWSTSYDSGSGTSDIIVTNGTIQVNTTKNSYNITAAKIVVTDKNGNIALYDDLSKIPGNKYREFIALITEVEAVIKTANNQGIISANNFTTALITLQTLDTALKAQTGDPVVSGF